MAGNGLQPLCFDGSILPSPSYHPFLSYKHLKLKLRVFLTGYTVAMVTYYVTKIIITCSPMIGHLFDTFILTSTDIGCVCMYVCMYV